MAVPALRLAAGKEGRLTFSIFGSVFGAIGSLSLGVVLMERGSVKLGLAGLLTGVAAQVLGPSIFGIAAFAQPAIGRFYLAGHHDLAQNLYYDAAQGTPMVIVARRRWTSTGSQLNRWLPHRADESVAAQCQQISRQADWVPRQASSGGRSD